MTKIILPTGVIVSSNNDAVIRAYLQSGGKEMVEKTEKPVKSEVHKEPKKKNKSK